MLGKNRRKNNLNILKAMVVGYLRIWVSEIPISRTPDILLDYLFSTFYTVDVAKFRTSARRNSAAIVARHVAERCPRELVTFARTEETVVDNSNGRPSNCQHDLLRVLLVRE